MALPAHHYSTTTHLTTAWAESLSHVFGFSGSNKFFEFLVRGVCPYINVQLNICLRNPDFLY